MLVKSETNNIKLMTTAAQVDKTESSCPRLLEKAGNSDFATFNTNTAKLGRAKLWIDDAKPRQAKSRVKGVSSAWPKPKADVVEAEQV